jgi:hypothetical protein
LLAAVKPGDVQAVIARMLELAREGDTQAARLLLDRVLGPPIPADVWEEIETLRKDVEEITDGHIRRR